MINFLIRAWFEKRERKTKEEFASLKEKQFNELVDGIRNFCDRCWESDSWSELWSHFTYMFDSKDRCVGHVSDWSYQDLKRRYEAFIKEHGAHIENLIEIYRNLYDEIWKNTDLDVSDVHVHSKERRVSYEIDVNYNCQIRPRFNYYAKGWNQKWHVAYCALADIMLLLEKNCEIFQKLFRHFTDEYRCCYYFYDIKRTDKPENEDKKVYEEAKQKFEAEIDVESDLKKEDLAVEMKKYIVENGFCKRLTADGEVEMSWI